MQHFINVRGKRSEWSFPIKAPPSVIEAYRRDGLDIIEVHNTIPAWVAGLGLTRPWCWLQDLFA